MYLFIFQVSQVLFRVDNVKSDEVVQISLAGTKFGKLKFIYSEKATKFCEIFPLLLSTVHTVKIKGKISQNFVAFSEYMNFIRIL